MAISNSADITNSFVEAIDAAVKQDIEKSFDRHMEAFKQEADSIRAEVIAGAIMKMSKWYSFQNLGETLRIEVRNPKETP
jgi:hypothetical protein